ncbi:MAG: hypothetical protein ACJAS1_007026 [Oleiphilaceae bacterium]|jgi:hypothetical protein
MEAFELGTFTLGSLLGLILGALLGHSLAIRRGKHQTKHNAAIEFKKVVIPAIDELEHGNSQFDIIQSNFDNHYQAAIDYSVYLNGRELDSFRAALSEYKQWRNIMYGRSASEIFYDTEDPEYLSAKEKKPDFLLNELLKYANT